MAEEVETPRALAEAPEETADDIIDQITREEETAASHEQQPDISPEVEEVTEVEKTTEVVVEEEEQPKTEEPEDEPLVDPLSIEHENARELALMADITTLQTDLAEAATKVNTLQAQLHAMEKYKAVADSFVTISEGATDPAEWFSTVMRVEKEEKLKVALKNQELTKKINVLERERNDSVVKNAKIEKSILDAKKAAETATKEAKKAKASDDKARADAERCRKMSNQAIKEHATMKEHYTNNLNKLKWTENKLNAESEALVAEREKTAKLQRELKEAREETSQIRANTQQIISTYQNSEEVRSNALDGELKSLKEQFESMQAERNQLQTLLDEKTEKLAVSEAQLLDATNKVSCLDGEVLQLTEERDTMAETLNRQKGDLTDLGSRLAQTQKRLTDAESERDALSNEIQAANERAQDREAQAAALAGRESELLATVSQLTLTNSTLQGKVTASTAECGELRVAKGALEEAQSQLDQVKTNFKVLEESSTSEIAQLKIDLSSVTGEAETASNRMRALEKQNATLKKELRTALATPMPRSQSINSIESLGKQNSQVSTPTQSPRPERVKHEVIGDGGLNDMNKGDIIVKLVNLQKQFVKRNEKIDFLSDHVAQLTEELKKKTKLIQSFLLREQHGRIKPPGREQEVHRKVNLIMDSIYAPNSTDNINMLKEVNKQLQLVLEDTLFKNIMQQDNIKHLGEEIDKLQRRSTWKPNTR